MTKNRKKARPICLALTRYICLIIKPNQKRSVLTHKLSEDMVSYATVANAFFFIVS
jgi:hypothetical protein